MFFTTGGRVGDLVVLLFVGGIALCGWLLVTRIANQWRSREISRAEHTALIARADDQHTRIISGDETGGTYGQYQPADLDTVVVPRRDMGGVAEAVETVAETGRLEADFVGRTLRYTDHHGHCRSAEFPNFPQLHPDDPKNQLSLDDVARLLASVRGWSNVGGQNQWWRLTFDEHATEDDSFGVEVPNGLTLDLTGRNPRTEFDSYISLRGNDPILWGYGRAKGREEEKFSHVGSALLGARFLYNTIQDGLVDAEAKGFIGDTDVMLMRVIYRASGENEFEVRMPCRYEKPKDWTPDWD